MKVTVKLDTDGSQIGCNIMCRINSSNMKIIDFFKQRYVLKYPSSVQENTGRSKRMRVMGNVDVDVDAQMVTDAEGEGSGRAKAKAAVDLIKTRFETFLNNFIKKFNEAIREYVTNFEEEYSRLPTAGDSDLQKIAFLQNVIIEY